MVVKFEILKNVFYFSTNTFSEHSQKYIDKKKQRLPKVPNIYTFITNKEIHI